MHRTNHRDLVAQAAVLDHFFMSLRTSASRVLLLDFDGTLAPFCDDPTLAFPYPEVKDALLRIHASAKSRVLIVSGRQSQEVATLLGIRGIEIWGCHGMELLQKDGTLMQLDLDPEVQAALQVTNRFLSDQDLDRYVERKPTGSAVHWRGLPEGEAEDVRRRVDAVWKSLLEKETLRILRFDGGIEICVAAINKGDVVRTVMSESQQVCSMAYLGDDVTDEDAFQALKGIGLGVLVRSSDRESCADVWIRPPDGVIEFLENWLEACEQIS